MSNEFGTFWWYTGGIALLGLMAGLGISEKYDINAFVGGGLGTLVGGIFGIVVAHSVINS